MSDLWNSRDEVCQPESRNTGSRNTDFSSGSYFLLQMRNPAIETAQKLYENVQLRPIIEVRRQRLGMDKKRFIFYLFLNLPLFAVVSCACLLCF